MDNYFVILFLKKKKREFKEQHINPDYREWRPSDKILKNQKKYSGR